MLHILAVDHCEEDRIKKKRVYLICLIVLSICSAVGDKIQAYTVDHVSYGYEKESILPAKEHKCNEFMKFIGVLTGCCMILVALFYLLS